MELNDDMKSNPLQCPECGTLRVVTYIKRNLKVICPKCSAKGRIILSKDAQKHWLKQISEQIYKCTVCGKPIPNPTSIKSPGGWILLRMTCPDRCTHNEKRYILKELYPAIQNYHSIENPNIDAQPLQKLPPSQDWLWVVFICIPMGIALLAITSLFYSDPDPSVLDFMLIFFIIGIGSLIAGVTCLAIYLILRRRGS